LRVDLVPIDGPEAKAMSKAEDAPFDIVGTRVLGSLFKKQLPSLET
jgi:hypothetical protein